MRRQDVGLGSLSFWVPGSRAKISLCMVCTRRACTHIFSESKAVTRTLQRSHEHHGMFSLLLFMLLRPRCPLSIGSLSSLAAEAERLVKGVNVLVVTPGRLLDHLQVCCCGNVLKSDQRQRPLLLAINLLMLLSPPVQRRSIYFCFLETQL